MYIYILSIHKYYVSIQKSSIDSNKEPVIINHVPQRVPKKLFFIHKRAPNYFYTYSNKEPQMINKKPQTMSTELYTFKIKGPGPRFWTPGPLQGIESQLEPNLLSKELYIFQQRYAYNQQRAADSFFRAPHIPTKAPYHFYKAL